MLDTEGLSSNPTSATLQRREFFFLLSSGSAKLPSAAGESLTSENMQSAYSKTWQHSVICPEHKASYWRSQAL